MKCVNKDIDVHNSTISTKQDDKMYSDGFRNPDQSTFSQMAYEMGVLAEIFR